MVKNFIIDGVVLPINPSKLDIKSTNNNKSVMLLDGNEMNILKKPGLKTYSFTALLPNQYYSFCNYEEKSLPKARYFLDIIEKLKEDEKVFTFMVSHEVTDNGIMDDINVRVALENYSITEDAKNGSDIVVNITLKEYVDIVAKSEVVTEEGVVEESVRPSQKEVAKSYVVKKGDSLWEICKRELGDGSLYNSIAKLNGISNPNQISIGEVIYFE